MPRPVGDEPKQIAEREKWYSCPLIPSQFLSASNRTLHYDSLCSHHVSHRGKLTPNPFSTSRDAWHANHSLTYTEAKRRYITTLIETMHAYASTTPEARDLVAELEFVWDQIKSDPASTSSASSPDQKALVGYEGRASQRPEDGELKLLRPASEPDEAEDGEDEEEEEDIAEARASPYDAEGTLFAPRSSDYDIRNRKWRRRIEAALVKMTAEVAALREQMEARRLLYDGARRSERRKVWVWVEWLVGAMVRHVLVDAAVVGVLWLWFRGGGERGVRLLMGVVRERGRRMELWRRRRLWGTG